VVVVAVACAGGVALPSGAASGSLHPDCRPAGARTVVYNRRIKLYTRRDAHGHDDPLYACKRPEGRRELLIGGPEFLWFEPPAIALSGQVAAVTTRVFDPTEATETAIYVFDLAAPRNKDMKRAIQVGFGDDVGSVAVNASYDVALIECPPVGTSSDNDVPGPQCLKPGRTTSFVYVVRAGQDRLKEIDHGRRIDPLSLRRHGDRITWVKGGKRRSAPLP
jgi:hypothetical protein